MSHFMDLLIWGSPTLSLDTKGSWLYLGEGRQASHQPLMPRPQNKLCLFVSSACLSTSPLCISKPNSAHYLKATYHGEETFLRVTASSYNHEDTIQNRSLLSVSYAGINNLTQCHQIWQNKPSWRQEDFLVQQLTH